VSIASPPPVVKKIFASSIGATDASLSASSSAGRFAMSPKIE
jgi:hypothetical protein